MGRRWDVFRHSFYGCIPEATVGFDGASFSSRCRVCQRRCLCDSWGTWFPIGDGR